MNKSIKSKAVLNDQILPIFQKKRHLFLKSALELTWPMASVGVDQCGEEPIQPVSSATFLAHFFSVSGL